VRPAWADTPKRQPVTLQTLIRAHEQLVPTIERSEFGAVLDVLVSGDEDRRSDPAAAPRSRRWHHHQSSAASRYGFSSHSRVTPALSLLEARGLADEAQGEVYGGSVAAPAFQKIVGWTVPYFGINPCPSPCPASAMNPAVPSTP